jgi:hypothetical protein
LKRGYDDFIACWIDEVTTQAQEVTDDEEIQREELSNSLEKLRLAVKILGFES